MPWQQGSSRPGAKTTKTQGGSAPHKTLVPKPPTSSTLPAPTAQKITYITSTSTQPLIDQKADNKQKGTTTEEDKKILVDPNNLDMKLRISSNLDPK
jgi:hypothetical protein